jgi:predicted site-specific integrase-resolvase
LLALIVSDVRGAYLRPSPISQGLGVQFPGPTRNIGFARVSTLDQTLDLQMQALRKAGCKKIFREKLSGASPERPEFQRMLDQLRNGDNGHRLEAGPFSPLHSRFWIKMETIREAGARFQSLSEPSRI